jgi:hypothetical protein
MKDERDSYMQLHKGVSVVAFEEMLARVLPIVLLLAPACGGAGPVGLGGPDSGDEPLYVGPDAGDGGAAIDAAELDGGDPADAATDGFLSDGAATDAGADSGACGGGCDGGLVCCSGICADTTGSDDNNCGGCGSVCSGSGKGCQKGSCVCIVDEGTCGHSPCSTGSALVSGCDPDTVVNFICSTLRPNCCSGAWDSTCVSDAISYGGLSCGGC